MKPQRSTSHRSIVHVKLTKLQHRRFKGVAYTTGLTMQEILERCVDRIGQHPRWLVLLDLTDGQERRD